MPRFYFSARRASDVSPRLRHLIWRAESWVIGFFLTLFRWLPLGAALRLAGSLAAAIGPHTPRAAKVRKNMRVVVPDANDTRLRHLVRASFRHAGTAMAELASLEQIWRERDKRIAFVVRAGARTPSPQRKVIFVTAHVGAWQLTPLVGPYYGLDVPTIYAREQNPYVDRQLVRLRRAFRGELVPSEGGMRVLMRALDRGQSIGLTLDTRPEGGGEQLPFFGENAPINTAPARLALRYGCDLVPVRAERLPRARYRVSIYPAVRPREPTAPIRDQTLDMSAQINTLIERWIAAAPGQWLCLKRRWPKDVYKRMAG